MAQKPTKQALPRPSGPRSPTLARQEPRSPFRAKVDDVAQQALILGNVLQTTQTIVAKIQQGLEALLNLLPENNTATSLITLLALVDNSQPIVSEIVRQLVGAPRLTRRGSGTRSSARSCRAGRRGTRS